MYALHSKLWILRKGDRTLQNVFETDVKAFSQSAKPGDYRLFNMVNEA